MKDKLKVTLMRCHVGVNVKGKVTTGIHGERDGVEMELHPAGVLCTWKTVKGDDAGKIIPYPNVTEIEVVAAEPEAKAPKKA